MTSITESNNISNVLHIQINKDENVHRYTVRRGGKDGEKESEREYKEGRKKYENFKVI